MEVIYTNDNLKTKQQWLKEGYIVPDDTEGKMGWTNQYCQHFSIWFTRDQVIYDPEQASMILKEHRRRNAEKIKQRKKEMFNKIEHTAWQWICLGYVPLDNAIWKQSNKYYEYDEYGSDKKISFTNKYYYCKGLYVKKNIRKADKLLEDYNENVLPADGSIPPYEIYDGRPWWLNNIKRRTK